MAQTNGITQMTKEAVDMRGDFIKTLYEAGWTTEQIENLMTENLNALDILFQVFANLENK